MLKPWRCASSKIKHTAILFYNIYEKATIKRTKCCLDFIMDWHLFHHIDRYPTHRRSIGPNDSHFGSIGFHSYRKIAEE